MRPLWRRLFETPIHLDSALAKTPPDVRARIADVVQATLRRPVSLARALGITIPAGEPWSLGARELADWRPAGEMAERVLSGAEIAFAGSAADDFPPALRHLPLGVLEFLASRPPLVLRATRALGKEGLIAALGRQAARPSPIAPLGVVIDGGYAPVTRHPLFAEGAFEIQDDGAQVLALFALWPDRFAPLLSPRPGPAVVRSDAAAGLPDPPRSAVTIVDACAGAGGKTLAIADAMENKGRIFAYDVSKPKLEALRKRAKRARLTNVKTVLVDEESAGSTVSRFEAGADVVLVDAPCSGLGVLRRNPDAKWRLDLSSFGRLEAIEARLLHLHAPLVRPGGRLVYGVCTFRAEETESIAEAFLAAHPDFSSGPGGFLGPGPSDGFYMKAFERRP